MRLTWISEIGTLHDGRPTGAFICESSYNERFFPKAAGFRWDASRKHWFTFDAIKAARLKDYADEAALTAMGDLARAESDALAESHAEDAEIEVPAPNGLAYLPYQRAGIAYALKRPATLIADEMGLGKTIQAIGLVNASTFTRAPRILIVCPASLRLNWRREWAKWCTRDIQPMAIKDIWHRGLYDRELPKGLAAILSYEGAVKWAAHIGKTEWDVLLCDEAHYLKNGSAKRTHAIFGYYANQPAREGYFPEIKATRRLFLTGTPVVNRPLELWPLLHSIDPNGLGASPKTYRERYIYMVPDGPAPRNQDEVKHLERTRLAELHRRLRASVMVRRLKADVLKELPAKRRQIVLLDMEAGALARQEQEAVSKAARMAQERRREIEVLRSRGDDGAVRAAVQRLQECRSTAIAELAILRHKSAVAKIPAVIEHMFTVLDETPKLVIFAHHHDVVDGIAGGLPRASVRIDGRMTQEARDAAVARFQTDDGVRLLVASIKAAGLGFTFTAASVVCFAELDWTPSAMVQAEDRLHRIGQRDSVLVQHLVVDGTIDAMMAKILIRKADMIGQIVDGKMPEELSKPVLDDLLYGPLGQSSSS